MKKIDISNSKTLEEWDALEKAERKTLKGKIKYAYKDYLYYPIFRFFENVKNVPNEIKWFIQRGKRGYADSDVWSLDWYLSEWLPKAIRQLKKRTNGYPLAFLKNPKGWKDILESIAKGFEADFRIKDGVLYEGKLYDKLVQLRKEGFGLFVKYYDNLWD